MKRLRHRLPYGYFGGCIGRQSRLLLRSSYELLDLFELWTLLTRIWMAQPLLPHLFLGGLLFATPTPNVQLFLLCFPRRLFCQPILLLLLLFGTPITTRLTVFTEENTVSTACKVVQRNETQIVHVGGERGVDPAYINLLQEAERRSSLDYENRRTRMRGDAAAGFVIGPTEGNFDKYALVALRNAQRIKTVMAMDNSSSTSTVNVAWMASPEHIAIVEQCRDMMQNRSYYPEACRLWANGTLFADVITTPERQSKHEKFTFWLKALGGYIHAPYKTTIFLDSDAFACPGVQKLFAITNPRQQNYWQFPTLSTPDLAVGIDQYESAGPRGEVVKFTPGDPSVLQDFVDFPERNTGTVLFHFHRRLAYTFAHFVLLVAEYVSNHVALDNRLGLYNDQCPFKIGLYVFRRLRPEFVDLQLPMHASCRSYPGVDHAGTDGFLNGMYPIQQDGTRCRECYCTPCLIHHTPTYRLKVNGRMGWETTTGAT
mmetsp:Transcript_11648/g.24565  ORF Transcript_11648/g.24565 Transcript_11648/m.24565 type:complete len:485 (+) Transcript_11648:174-1628(+)